MRLPFSIDPLRLSLAALAFSAAACASTQPPNSATESPQTTTQAGNAETAFADRVPAFSSLALATWGPLPRGEEHLLPDRIVDLTHQVIHVNFDWTRKAVVGSTTLQFVAIKPASVITLDAFDMNIKKVTGFLGSSSQVSGAVLKYTYDDKQNLVITPPKPLPPGGVLTVTVDYEAVEPKKGAYFVDRKHVVWTQGEMIETRHWVPTVDRPDEKTTWEIFVTVPKNEKALSNGALKGTRNVGADSVEFHWSQEKKASTYLFSIVTGDYTVIQDKWEDIPVGYWTYPDSVEAAKRGFKDTPDMIGVFSRITGIRYPWVKYDQSAVPDFIFGGMENVTATTQNDKTVLIPAAEESRRDAQALVAHELAHQWFGNLVTLKDWSHAWLNEGFATYFETIYFEESNQAERAALNRVSDQRQAIAADTRARRPLVYSRWSSDPVELFFSGHIYPKGAAVLDMLRTTVGDSLFWKSINLYLTKNAYGSVVSDDLRAAFEEASGKNLKEFFQQWVYGAGYPALQIGHSYDARSKTLTLTAKQVQPRDSLTGFFTMNVDVEVLTDDGPVKSVAEVRGEITTLSIRLQSAPRAITWDPNRRWLQVIDFPRSTNMLVYQLQHGGILSKAEASDLLRTRASRDAVAQEALQRAETERQSKTAR